MSINWNELGQTRFDRAVENLIRRRFGTARSVRVVDGRGGDGGIDIDVVADDGRLLIFQLKYFPEGFSGGHGKSRRPQIKRSFTRALEHNPDEWILVVPRVLTVGEDKFVKELNGGTVPPEITIVGRDELDSWLADDPTLDELPAARCEHYLGAVGPCVQPRTRGTACRVERRRDTRAESRQCGR